MPEYKSGPEELKAYLDEHYKKAWNEAIEAAAELEAEIYGEGYGSEQIRKLKR